MHDLCVCPTGATQSSPYTCPPALSLCPGTYTACSCTIPSGLQNRWSISLGSCAISINKAIQLKRTGNRCATEYQQNGLFIRAWNEPKVNTCNSNETILCETSTLLIHANYYLNGTTFECLDDVNGSYGNTTLSIICKLHIFYCECLNVLLALQILLTIQILLLYTVTTLHSWSLHGLQQAVVALQPASMSALVM